MSHNTGNNSIFVEHLVVLPEYIVGFYEGVTAKTPTFDKRRRYPVAYEWGRLVGTWAKARNSKCPPAVSFFDHCHLVTSAIYEKAI